MVTICLKYALVTVITLLQHQNDLQHWKDQLALSIVNILFQPEDMHNLCLIFNASQSLYGCKRYVYKNRV